MNIESLADQVYGLDILTATTGQLAAASSGLTDVASRKQIENFEVFNNMMVSSKVVKCTVSAEYIGT